jgi:ZIP family zinc transporter
MVFFVGLFSVSSLVLGGLIGAYWNINRKLLGMIMGFGAGALISAVAYDLVLEAVELGGGSFFPISGLFAGAAVFLILDSLIEFFGHRVRAGSPNQDSASLGSSVKLLVPMVLAIILDGIPESIVLGLGMFKDGSVRTSILLAVFVSN